MNIALIGTHDISGGAAKAMNRLHNALIKQNQNSYIFSKIKQTNDKKTIHISPKFNPSLNPDIKLEKFIQINYMDKNKTNLSNVLFTFPYPGYDFSHLLKDF